MLKKILLACMCFPLLAFADLDISQFAIVESRELSRGQGDRNFRELALGPIEHHGHSLEAKGKKILYHLWRDFKNANAKSISKYTSPQFQSIHANGALNKKQELELVRNLHYTSFALSQIKITEMKGTMVISYIATVNEIVNNQPVSSTEPRLSIFKKADKKWKWLAHSNATK